MADTVDTIVLQAGGKRHIARFTNVSDGTGESAVVKIDISTLLMSNGYAPTRTAIEAITWTIQGFTSVRLFWDHTTDDEIDVLSGAGHRDYTCTGNLIDPASTGGTGDILLTTAGAASGATYDILISVRLF